MKHSILFTVILLVVISCTSKTSSTSSASYPEAALGWELGAGSYCFKNFTFLEALDKIDSCGLKYVEGSPIHTIGGGLEEKLSYKMNASTRDFVLRELKERDIKMNAYGVISPDSEAEWRELFEFGKAMGIQTFSSQPKKRFIPLISRLCDEYGINVTLHNHPYPSRYWHPDTVRIALEGQSKRMGACADIGHWVRSGLDPVDCLKKLEGRVLHLHMKDLNEKSKMEAHDVPWGTGVSGVSLIIEELKRQDFKGIVSAEYEHNWNNSVPDIKASVEFFRSELE